MWSIDEATKISEIVKNVAEALAVIGGGFALYRWLHERNDRATEVLFQLEERFQKKAVATGRALLEEDAVWSELRHKLGGRQVNESDQAVIDQALKTLDPLLRFYVVLVGVREAGQVPDTALLACYRYWLAHYYSPRRTYFKMYVDKYFPTLEQWLKKDQKPYRVWLGVDFFRPRDFKFESWPAIELPPKTNTQTAA